jgi:hypothetical protein
VAGCCAKECMHCDVRRAARQSVALCISSDDGGKLFCAEISECDMG